MSRIDRSITIHECFFAEQAYKIKRAVSEIVQKDSLSAADTEAIRILTDAYDCLINPRPEDYAHYQANCNSGLSEELQ